MYHWGQHIYDIDCVLFFWKFQSKVNFVNVVNMPCGKMGSNNRFTEWHGVSISLEMMAMKGQWDVNNIKSIPHTNHWPYFILLFRFLFVYGSHAKRAKNICMTVLLKWCCFLRKHILYKGEIQRNIQPYSHPVANENENEYRTQIHVVVSTTGLTVLLCTSKTSTMRL